MLILSVIKNVERLNERVLLVRFVDNSTMTVDRYENSIDIISKDGLTSSWANIISKNDIKTYWNLLLDMSKK